MKLSTMTGYLHDLYGDEKALEMIAAAGFDAADYTIYNADAPDSILQREDYKERALEIKHVAEDLGLTINQCHAPFLFNYSDPAGFGYAEKMVRRAIEVAGVMDVDNIVIHPLHYRRYKENATFVHFENVKLYDSLLPVAIESGVTICAENMWQWNKEGTAILPDECSFADEYSFLVDEVGSKNFVACLDIGHAVLTAEETGWTVPDFIEKLGNKRLRALHIHDVDGVLDSHTAPFLGKTDWTEVIAALKKIKYKGDFTFEADPFLKSYPEDFTPVALKFLEETGRLILRKFKEK